MNPPDLVEKSYAFDSRMRYDAEKLDHCYSDEMVRTPLEAPTYGIHDNYGSTRNAFVTGGIA